MKKKYQYGAPSYLMPGRILVGAKELIIIKACGVTAESDFDILNSDNKELLKFMQGCSEARNNVFE